ncbi:ADP-ribosylation factor GTPase-activating protein AGD3 [Trifolium repens]|nr:ADP-ribosylation factor GTPase-activating protein AGD3 [Trifolium repens]
MYQNASGQLVNVHKFELMFSKQVIDSRKEEIHNILPMQRVEHFSKYLGVPTHIGRSKNQAFQFILDRIWKKLKGWKEKNLSFAGRATLIKAVNAKFIGFVGQAGVETPNLPPITCSQNPKSKVLPQQGFSEGKTGAEHELLMAEHQKGKRDPKKVFDLIDTQNRAWKEEVIKQNFYPMEAKQICSMALPNYNQEDFISWKGTKDGHYSVKSGYQAILAWQESQNPSPNSSNMDNTRWKKLWNLFVPPKQIHHIWRILNNAIHGTKALAVNPGNTRHNNGWSPPPKGSLKLNVDAHSLSDGHWGLGLVLRREDGNHVGAATRVRKGTDCVLLAEAMGLQEVMELVDKWKLQNTIIELDAKVIVDTIHNGRNPRTNWGCITTMCREWLKEKRNITIVWTKHSGNSVAHELAKWATIEPNKEWGTLAPYCSLNPKAHEKFVSLRESSKFDVASVIEESLNQQCTQWNCANENNVGILSRLLSSQDHGVVPDEKSVARHTVNLLTSTIKVDAEQSDLRFCFRIISPSKMYTLQAENALDQMDWMEKINGVIVSLLSVQTLGVKTEESLKRRKIGSLPAL